MCLLIIKPAGVDIAPDVTLRAVDAHPDGFGLAYAANGRVHTIKGVGIAAKDIIDVIAARRDDTCIVHWRMATHGRVIYDNAHPFDLADGGALAHNGVLSGFGSREVSDTRDFVARIMAHVVGPRAIRRAKPLLNHIIRGSRMATIHPGGDVVRLGEGWIKRDGLIASNTSGFESRGKSRLWSWFDRHVEDECDACGARGSDVRESSDLDGRPMYLCAECVAEIATYADR